MESKNPNKKKYDDNTTGGILNSAVSGVIGYWLARRKSSTQVTVQNQYTNVDPPPIVPEEDFLLDSDTVGYYPQMYMEKVLFNEDLNYMIQPFTGDILFVDCVYNEFKNVMDNNPNMTTAKKRKLVRVAVNMLTGLNSNAYALTEAAGIMCEYSPINAIAGSSFVQPISDLYHEPYGKNRRRIDSRRVNNVSKKLTHMLNDMLNRPAYLESSTSYSLKPIGAFVGISNDKSYRELLHEKLMAGTLSLPAIDPTHVKIRDYFSGRQLRRIFINHFNRLLIVDYPLTPAPQSNGEYQGSMWTALSTLLMAYQPNTINS